MTETMQTTSALSCLHLIRLLRSCDHFSNKSLYLASHVSRCRLAIRISHSFVLKMNSSKITSVCLFAVVLICGVAQAADQVDGAEEVSLSEEQLDYAKGSVCGYCTYCKFCKLCDQDCPCETSPSKPNCKMCKYCRYCNLCSAVCDTICTPGGILDRVSSSIISSLPSANVDRDEVESDIKSMKTWIERKKDEL